MFVVKPLASFAHTPVVLVGGLAGSGKSTVSQWAAEDLQLLHLEVDLPGTDGINFHSLRSEWDAFHLRNAGERLAAEIRRRSEAAGKRGAILSFPSNMKFTPDRIAGAKAADMEVVIVWGSPEVCLRAFLDREQATGRGFDERRWHKFNREAAALYSGDAYEPLRLHAFTADGERRPRGACMADFAQRIGGLSSSALSRSSAEILKSPPKPPTLKE